MLLYDRDATGKDLPWVAGRHGVAIDDNFSGCRGDQPTRAVPLKVEDWIAKAQQIIM